MLKEIDTYIDILSGERDFPEIGNECLETCPPDCEEHKWYCVYWIRLAPEVEYSDNYYDYASTVNNAEVYTDGYVGVSRRLEGRYKEHRYVDTGDNQALLKELFEWYGDDIQLLILEEGISKTEAYEVETYYRPYPNIGWNKAEGGNCPPSLTEETQQKAHKWMKEGVKWVWDTKDNTLRRIPINDVQKYLQANPSFSIGKPNQHLVKVFTLRNGNITRTLTKQQWATFFNISERTFMKCIKPSHYLEINGKEYPAISHTYQHVKVPRLPLQTVLNINHSIHDWEFIKEERRIDYETTLNTERG